MNVLGKVFTPRSQEDDPARSSASWLGRGNAYRSQTQSPRRATTRLPGVERFEERVLLSDGPTVVDPNLAVRTVVTGLTTPPAGVFSGQRLPGVAEEYRPKQTGSSGR